MTQPTRSRDLRVRATFRVRYRTLDELVVAYSKNLSRGGLFLTTSKLLPRGTVVQVKIQLPDDGPEITVPCEVAFTRDATQASGRGGMGVKFIDPDQMARRRLEWFILNSAPEAGQFGAEPRARKLDLVIVEDEPLQSEAAASPFRQRGDQVRICRDGLEALASCLDHPPDVILSDVQMPKLDGWQLLRMLRARPTLATVPVVFLTQLSGEQDRLRGYRLGVDDYVAKPYEPSELVARIDRAVVRAEHQAQPIQRPAQDALRGDLEQVSLPSLLSFLEAEQKSGVVRVGPVTNGRIYVSEGRPVRAEVYDDPAGTSSRELLFQLLGLSVGRFDFNAQRVSLPDEIGEATSELLRDYARLCEEGCSAPTS
jgi:uncharacterized protein (TIGR02266 family)